MKRAVQVGVLLGLLVAGAARADEDVIVKAAFPGGAVLNIEVAETPEKQMVGLMHRNSMPDDWGMLFVYPRDRVMSFWMKNTRIPLAIAFIHADGRIESIRHMKPFDETRRHRSRRAVRYALEVNEGWFRRNGIRPGQRVAFLSRRILAGEPRPAIPSPDGFTYEDVVPQDPRGLIPVGDPVKAGGR